MVEPDSVASLLNYQLFQAVSSLASPFSLEVIMSAAQFTMLTVDAVTAFPSLPGPQCPLQRIRNCARPGISSEPTSRTSTAESELGLSRGSEKGVQDRVVGPGPNSEKAGPN